MPSISIGRPSVSLRPNRKTAILLGSTAGAILVLTGGLFWWQSGEVERINKEVEDKNTQAAHGERTAQQLDSVRQEASVVDGKLRNLEQNVSFGAYIPTLLRQMENRARLHGLIVNGSRQAIEVVPPPPPLTKEEIKEGKTQPPPPPYDRARIDMDLTGTYGNIARFLHSLTRFEKIIAVTSVQEQSRLDRTGASPTLAVRVTMVGYVFKDAPTEDTGQTPDKPLGAIGRQRADERKILDSTKDPQRK